MTYELSFDKARVQFEVVHAALAGEYWSPNIRADVLQRAIANSFVVSAFTGAEQVGFARIVSDEATFAWLCDVWVAQAHRGRGVAKQMLAALVAEPRFQTLRRFALATRDAHTLYAQFGFAAVPDGVWMELRPPASAWQD